MNILCVGYIRYSVCILNIVNILFREDILNRLNIVKILHI